MQVKAEEITVEQAIQEIVDIEVEEDEGDPLEGLNNADITEIYGKLKPEDRRLFRQFHKTYYELHGHDTPSHQLARGIIREMFSGLPARDADTIAAARAELLATERLRDLCKQLGLAVPEELQTHQRPEALEYPPPPLPLHFPSQQDKQRQLAQEQQPVQPEPLTEAEPKDVRPDVKPPRRLATSYLGKPGLLHMLGTGHEDHIITRVVPRTAPLQEYEEDNPADIITIDYEMDNSDVDDLSEVSMTSAGGIAKEELQGLLVNIAASHQKVAESMDTLAARVEDMSTDHRPS